MKMKTLVLNLTLCLALLSTNAFATTLSVANETSMNIAWKTKFEGCGKGKIVPSSSTLIAGSTASFGAEGETCSGRTGTGAPAQFTFVFSNSTTDSCEITVGAESGVSGLVASSSDTASSFQCKLSQDKSVLILAPLTETNA